MAKPLPNGIYGIIGPPGAGKSFKAVREIANRACQQPRPIYTNIPIVPKRLRAYIYVRLPKKIRGHRARRARANLVSPITQRHFSRYCARLAKIDATAEAVMDEWGMDRGAVGKLAEFKQTEARNEAMRRVAEDDGPPVIQGKDADWIPPGSILFLDELHKWYPSRNYKDEAPEVLAFTSMHRHCQLMVFVLSQRWMNVSLSFRSMAKEVWFCMNWARAPLLGFIRLSTWFNVFRYVHYLGEDVEERTGMPRIGAKPVWSEMIWPELSGAPEFGCYRSFSHAGSLEDQQNEIERLTAELMGEDPEQVKQQQRQREAEAMAKKEKLGKRINKGITLAGLAGLCFMVGRCTTPPKEVIVERTAPQTADQAEADADTPDTDATPDTPPPAIAAATNTTPTADPDPPAWADQRATGISRAGVQIEGRTYGLGETVEGGLFLVAVDAEIGSSIWIGPDGTCYHWRVGRVPAVGVLPEPVRRSLVEQVRAGTPAGGAADAPGAP